MTCPENCNITNQNCNFNNGTCTGNCNTNFIGDFCDLCSNLGFWGVNCTTACPANCNVTTSNCGAKDGSCNNHCKSGWNGTFCDSCALGFYGDKCDQPCPVNCDVSTVNCAKDGTCEGHCKSNWSGSLCTTCTNGFWSQNCNETCPQHCNVTQENCAMVDGSCDSHCYTNFVGKNCTTCVNGFYSENCDQSCPKNCNTTTVNCDATNGTCDQHCNSNFQGSTCEECVLGFWSENCNQTCPVNCDFSTKNCNTNGTCGDHCKANFAGDLCDTCATLGFWGTNCDNPCPANCDTTTKNCKQVNGTCGDHCKGNFAGDQCETCKLGFYDEKKCDQACPANCDVSTLNCDDQGKCGTHCKANFQGDNCDTCVAGLWGLNCLNKCPVTCHSCDINNGACKGDCNVNFQGDSCDYCLNDGNYGLNCDQKCTGCPTACNIFGECKDHQCKPQYYGGAKCTKPCATECGVQGCDKYTGECLNCAAGFYGPKCEKTCDPSCNNNLECCSAKDKTFNTVQFSAQTNTDNVLTANVCFGTAAQQCLNVVLDLASTSLLTLPFDQIFTSVKPENFDIKYSQKNSTTAKNSTDTSNYYVSDFNLVSFTNGFKALDNIVLNQQEIDNFIFILAENGNTKRDVTNKISGAVGLGNNSLFMEYLYNTLNPTTGNPVIQKNLIVLSRLNGTTQVTLGNYPADAQSEIANITSCPHPENTSNVCVLNGISSGNFSNAYQVKEINATLDFNNNSPSTFSYPNALVPYFEQVYFKNSDCNKIVVNDLTTFSCLSNFDVTKLPNLGFAMGGYAYSINPSLLFTKNSSSPNVTETDATDYSLNFNVQFSDTQPNFANLNNDVLSLYNVVFSNKLSTPAFYGTKRTPVGLSPLPDCFDNCGGEGLTWWVILLIILGAIILCVVVFFVVRSFFKKREVEPLLR
jgi:hypothetical protein